MSSAEDGNDDTVSVSDFLKLHSTPSSAESPTHNAIDNRAVKSKGTSSAPLKSQSQLKKTGRPAAAESREKLKLVNFRADAQTLDAIAELTSAFPPGALGRQGAAIRTALIDAAARLAKAIPLAAAELEKPEKVSSENDQPWQIWKNKIENWWRNTTKEQRPDSITAAEVAVVVGQLKNIDGVPKSVLTAIGVAMKRVGFVRLTSSRRYVPNSVLFEAGAGPTSLYNAVCNWPVADGVGVTSGDLVRMAYESVHIGDAAEEAEEKKKSKAWRTALLEWCPPKRGSELPRSNALGMKLRSINGMIVGQYKIAGSKHGENGVVWYRFSTMSEKANPLSVEEKRIEELQLVKGYTDYPALYDFVYSWPIADEVKVSSKTLIVLADGKHEAWRAALLKLCPPKYGTDLLTPNTLSSKLKSINGMIIGQYKILGHTEYKIHKSWYRAAV